MINKKKDVDDNEREMKKRRSYEEKECELGASELGLMCTHQYI